MGRICPHPSSLVGIRDKLLTQSILLTYISGYSMQYRCRLNEFISSLNVNSQFGCVLLWYFFKAVSSDVSRHDIFFAQSVLMYLGVASFRAVSSDVSPHVIFLRSQFWCISAWDIIFSAVQNDLTQLKCRQTNFSKPVCAIRKWSTIFSYFPQSMKHSGQEEE